jgi:hypothetical protein
MVDKIPAGNLAYPIAPHARNVTVSKYVGRASRNQFEGESGKMKLFPMTEDEAGFLVGLLESPGMEASELSMGSKHRGQMVNIDLMRITSILKSGGLNVYVGSVTDQEGDSSWELTSSLRHIRAWADDMAILSFEVPRTYRVSVTRNGFGAAKRLKMKRRAAAPANG